MTTLKRSYMSSDVDDRIEKFARNSKITKIQAFDKLIKSTIDENGILYNIINLTDDQIKIIEDISHIIKVDKNEVVNDLINFSIMIYGSNMTFRDILIKLSPFFIDEMVHTNPGIAKDIIKGIEK